MILFNMDVPEDRATYHIDGYGRVRWYNCGRYPTYSFAARTEKLREANIAFSLLFGGGARYSNGEDSLFLAECIRKGLKVYKAPVTIGKENGRPSTWFHGYNEKFFYDRGVLYHFLYGKAAFLMALRFLYKQKDVMCKEFSFREAFALMRRGIRMEKERGRNDFLRSSGRGYDCAGMFGKQGIRLAGEGRAATVTRRQAMNGAVLFTLFLIMAGTASLRIDVGNDYGNYVTTFHEIYVGGYVVTELASTFW